MREKSIDEYRILNFEMGKLFSHLTIEQREFFKKCMGKGTSKREIARQLGVHVSTVYRELKRGSEDCVKNESKSTKGIKSEAYRVKYIATGGYSPQKAQKRYRKLLEEKGRDPILIDKEISTIISKLILEEMLSPEQIIRKLKTMGYNEPSSVNTIYTAIDKGLIPNVSRESMWNKEAKVFSKGLVQIPKWVRDELDIIDGDVVVFEIKGRKIEITKNTNSEDKS